MVGLVPPGLPLAAPEHAGASERPVVGLDPLLPTVDSGPPRPAGPRPDAAPGEPAAPPAPRASLERRDPRAAVAGVVEGMLGVSLGPVPVVGGQPAERAAEHLGAAAFTAGGQVYLPPRAAAPGSARNLGILAHELTHVAQQRALGSVADEASPAGRRLEAQALDVGRAVERIARAPGALDAALPGGPVGRAPARSLTARVGAPPRLGAGGAAVAPESLLPLGVPVASGGGSAPGMSSALAPARLRPGPAAGLPVAHAQPGRAAPSPAGASPASAVAAQRLRLPGSATQLATDAKRLAGGTGRAVAASAGIRVGGPEGKREKHEPSEMERLAKEIYPYVRERLRAELLADRDRAGLVTDLYRTGLYGG